jgi:hypothetical protein
VQDSDDQLRAVHEVDAAAAVLRRPDAEGVGVSVDLDHLVPAQLPALVAVADEPDLLVAE